MKTNSKKGAKDPSGRVTGGLDKKQVQRKELSSDIRNPQKGEKNEAQETRRKIRTTGL